MTFEHVLHIDMTLGINRHVSKLASHEVSFPKTPFYSEYSNSLNIFGFPGSNLLLMDENTLAKTVDDLRNERHDGITSRQHK